MEKIRLLANCYCIKEIKHFLKRWHHITHTVSYTRAGCYNALPKKYG